jgi:putative Holliday junction resolvase
MRSEGRLLGLDLGSRRIGVAVTDSGQAVATGVRALTRSGTRSSDHAAIAGLVSEYQAVGVVVGVPLSLSGEPGPASREVLGEVSELRSTLEVEVATVDERLTTVAASSSLRAGGRSTRQQRAVVDQTAAAMILQTYVEQRRSRGLSH